MSRKSLAIQVQSLSEELSNKILSSPDAADNSLECLDLLKSLESITTKDKETRITIAILNETKIGICLKKLLKAFRRFNRSKDSNVNDGSGWKECINSTEMILGKWKEIVKIERDNFENKQINAVSNDTKQFNEEKTENGKNGGLPSSMSDYRSRLTTQRKEMYKDPPVLPPPSITIESSYCPLPKRDDSTGELTFILSANQTESLIAGSKLKEFIKDFKPNRTPEEVLRAGSFGGTYFRPIVSSVTNMQYKPAAVLKETVLPEWISGLDKRQVLTSSTYNMSVNKYKVKCGGSLGMWESSGWISDSDPYGWFQWYCNFYKGRRCNDDERQISRWLKSAGPKGRFRSQLCNKIFAQGGLKKVNDISISPVIRQTLLHWGLEITEDVLVKHGKRVGRF